MIEFLKKLQFKNDWRLFALAFALLVAAGFAVKFDYVTGKEALAFLVAAFGLPGFFGAKNNDHGVLP